VKVEEDKNEDHDFLTSLAVSTALGYNPLKWE